MSLKNFGPLDSLTGLPQYRVDIEARDDRAVLRAMDEAEGAVAGDAIAGWQSGEVGGVDQKFVEAGGGDGQGLPAVQQIDRDVALQADIARRERPRKPIGGEEAESAEIRLGARALPERSDRGLGTRLAKWTRDLAAEGGGGGAGERGCRDRTRRRVAEARQQACRAESGDDHGAGERGIDEADLLVGDQGVGRDDNDGGDGERRRQTGA